MNGLKKMEMVGFLNSDYTGDKKEFKVQINPSSLSWKKEINYQTDERVGGANAETKYVGHKEETLSFKITLDGTGALFSPGSEKPQQDNNSGQGDSSKQNKDTVQKRIRELEETLYNLVPDSHEPRYVTITWGEISFSGRTKSIDYEYTLFSPDGIPLRCTVSLSFSSHLDPTASAKKSNVQSPDLTRVITLRAGESIAGWCNEIYNDPSYCHDVARCNGLSSFRDVKPGVSLIFPPLNRHGRFTH